jgi:hypothetical protein
MAVAPAMAIAAECGAFFQPKRVVIFRFEPAARPARRPSTVAAMPTWKLACACAVSDGVPRRSLVVALVVGTILTLINQGDALLAGGAVDWVKIALTYCVPYAVCTYGAVAAQLARMRAQHGWNS